MWQRVWVWDEEWQWGVQASHFAVRPNLSVVAHSGHKTHGTGH